MMCSCHYNVVLISLIVCQITSLPIVYSIVYSDADQRKHQSSASLAFVRGIHREPVNSRTKGQYRGKCFHLMTSSWISNINGEHMARATMYAAHSSHFVGFSYQLILHLFSTIPSFALGQSCDCKWSNCEEYVWINHIDHQELKT